MATPSTATMGPPRKAGLDISTVCVPYTLGGSDLAAALQHQGINLNLSPEHYCQTDVSRNKDVWDLYPVEGGYGVDADDALWQVSRKASQECRRLVSFTHKTPRGLSPSPASLISTVSPHERGRIASNLRTLSLVYAGLISGGHYFPPIVEGNLFNFAALLSASKKAESAENVGEYFRSTHWGAAMTEYALILCELYPWTATPLLFAAEDAFKLGVAQLESSLWSQIAMTALNLSAIDARWLHIADAAAQSGIDMRYSTPKSLATSYWCSAQVRATLTPHESGCRAEKERTMAYMIVNSDDDDSWAHKDCVLEHVCWTIPDFTAASAPW